MPQSLELRPATALRSEPRLVADARRGDDRAFEELYSRYRQRIFAFILSRVRDHGRAEDIAQDVFMSALRRLRTTDQEIVLQPWLYTIAKNACIDEFRRGDRRTAVPVGCDDDLPVGRGSTLSLVPTPDDAIESKQRLNDLRGAFGGLSGTHRQLLVMREFEGRSYDEMGEQLGMSRQMVESSLFRARRKLGAEYDELATGRRCEQIVDAIAAGTFETVTGLGLKQRRRAIRHLSHCQSCRHHAMMSGVDEALLKPRSVADKLAALLPFGFWRKLWPHAHGGAGTAMAGGKAAGTLGGAAQAAAPAAAGSSISMGTAAVAAAVVAIAGAGGGIALSQGHSSHAAPPAHVSHAAGAGTTDHGSSGAAGQSSRSASATGHRLHPSVSLGANSVGSAGRKASKLHAKLGGTKTTGGAGATNRPGGGSAGGGHGGKTTGGGGSGSGGSSSGGSGSDGGSTGGGGSGNNPVGKTVSQAGNTVGKTVSQAGSAVGKTVSQTGSAVGKTVSQTGSAVGNTVSQTGSAVGNTVSQTGSAVGNTVSQTGSAVGNTVSQTGNAVGNTVSQTGNTVGGVVNKVAPGVGNTVSGVTNNVGNTVSQTGSTVGNTVSQAGNTVSQAGNTVSQTGNTVSQTGNTVSQTGNTVGTTVNQTGNTVGGVTGVVGGVLGGN
jgi:RNA polymerase sigma factor (sigma-70 family)